MKQWKEIGNRRVFESKCLNAKFEKTNIMLKRCNVKDVLSSSRPQPCGICSFRLKSNTVLCDKCGLCIHGRCTGVKMVISMLSMDLACSRC